ncbi:MAG: hypothetical protein AB7L41_00295 [Flavobacteriaceae bacterium]
MTDVTADNDYLTYVLLLAVLGTAYGAILLCVASAAAKERLADMLPQLLVALGVGALAMLLVVPPDRPRLLAGWGIGGQAAATLEDIATGAAIAAVAFVLSRVLFGFLFVEALAEVRPSAWPGAAEASARLKPRDHARRVFVATASGTGAVVAALFTSHVLWEALDDALRPMAVVGLVLVTGVSTVLVGPFRDYVLEGAADDAGWFDQLFSGKPSARSLLRFLLVGAMILGLELAYNCLGGALEARDPLLTTTIIIAALAPAVVSYYWSAALQLGLTSQPGAIVWASVVAGAAFNLLGCGILAAGLFGMPAGREGFAAMFLGGFALAMVSGFLLYGVYAGLGALVLERWRGRGALAVLAAAIAVAAVLQGLSSLALALALGKTIEPQSVLRFAAINAGWLAGLFSSGFPGLVVASHGNHSLNDPAPRR